NGQVVTLAESDAGAVANTVSVSGKGPGGGSTTGNDSTTTGGDTVTTPVAQVPHIKVVKSIDHITDADGSGTVTQGDTLFYKFVVTNDGNVTLNPTVVTDTTFRLAVS